MKPPTIKELSERAGVHIDTLFKIKRNVTRPSPKLAKRLEEITGINRDKWLYPDEFGNPWEELGIEQQNA